MHMRVEHGKSGYVKPENKGEPVVCDECGKKFEVRRYNDIRVLALRSQALGSVSEDQLFLLNKVGIGTR